MAKGSSLQCRIVCLLAARCCWVGVNAPLPINPASTPASAVPAVPTHSDGSLSTAAGQKGVVIADTWGAL